MTRILISLARHVVGYLILLPLVLIGIAVQALIMAPIFGDTVTVPHLIFRAIGLLFGVRFEFNPDNAPMSTDRPTLFVANHLSRIDFGLLYLFPKATVMMNAAFFKMPVFGPLMKIFANSTKIVGTDQTQEGKRIDQAALVVAIAAGRHLFVFPEGIQTDGRRLLRYSKGAGEIFYDPDLIAKAPNLKTALVQPVVLRVREVEGEIVLNYPERWAGYAMSRGLTSIFSGMYHASRVRSVTIDILVCPSLDPANYADAATLMNAAHDITCKVVAPQQANAITRENWRAKARTKDFSI